MTSTKAFTLYGLLLMAIPSLASADWLLTPYVGGVLMDVTDTGWRPIAGASVSWVGPVAGFELDLGIAPAFLESKTGNASDDSKLLTLMANGIVHIPVSSRRIRPFAVAGIGMVHTKVTMPGKSVDIEDEAFGFNVGGGVTVFLREHIGLSGDVRYFRSLRNGDATTAADALEIAELRFLRATAGVTFRF